MYFADEEPPCENAELSIIIIIIIIIIILSVWFSTFLWQMGV